MEVVFSASITNDVESVIWTFGDGATSTELNPTHTYDAVGSYTVSLTATNSYGTDVETKENYINVIGPEEVIASNYFFGTYHINVVFFCFYISAIRISCGKTYCI